MEISCQFLKNFLFSPEVPASKGFQMGKDIRPVLCFLNHVQKILQSGKYGYHLTDIPVLLRRYETY